MAVLDNIWFLVVPRRAYCAERGRMVAPSICAFANGAGLTLPAQARVQSSTVREP